MTRLYGRGFNGGRVYDCVPHGHWSATTMIAAVGTEGTQAPFVFEGAMDAAAMAVIDYCSGAEFCYIQSDEISILLRNDQTLDHHWLRVQLRQPGGNWEALGAKVAGSVSATRR